MACPSTQHSPMTRIIETATPARLTGARHMLMLAVLLLVACSAEPPVVFSTTASPDGAWTLRITVQPGRMAQSKFRIAATLTAAGESEGVTVVDTTLENDGVPFTSTNIAARWTTASSALLCLRATDLPDRGLRIETTPTPHAVEVEQC